MKKGKLIGKIFAIALVFTMVWTTLGGLASIASAADKFNIGDTVEVTANLNVRTGAGTSYPEITDTDYPGYAPEGTTGEVLDGPSSADGYIWWQVDFGPGLYSGWSVENWLEKVTPCPHSCWDRSALSGDELAALVRNHFSLGGVPQTGESTRVTAYAVAKAESGGNPSACGDNDRSIGLWQINIDAHPTYDKCLLFEEDYNANAAVEISSYGTDWNPWCTWETTACGGNGNEAYKQYLTEARKHFYPKVTSLSVSQTSINLGETVTIYYSVSDDVGLDRVELWRAVDVNGDGQPDWLSNPQDTKPASGQSASGYFEDSSHSSADIYWYGIHVVDNSGAPEAWNDERNSRTGGSPGVFGPIQVEVIAEDTVPPTVNDFSVIPSSLTSGNPFTISYMVSDSGGSGLGWIQLWRKYETADWEQVDSTSLSGVGNGPYSSSFSDTPLTVGTYWYGIHVGDDAGNWITEGGSGFSPIEVEVIPAGNPPQVTTEGASSITTSSAVLTGNLDSTGGETCQVWFEYGASTSYGSSTSKLSISSTGPFSALISSLSPDTTYHFRACAQNSKGTNYGSDMTFITKSDQIVIFPDPNLEAAIRDAIGKPTGDIYQSDLDGLTSLSAASRNIVNLSGMEHCTNLIYLYLVSNQISDIYPISGLTNLTSLYLGSNQISDIYPISGLTNLTSLYLESNQISDITPLSSLTSLIGLGLWSNQISNIMPLSNLINLTSLVLRYNQINDISALSNLTELELLDLGSNQINDISSLSKLTRLTFLWLESNQISDINPLSNLTSLTVMWLSSNQISDITPLHNLTSLEKLYLYGNQISDISPLSNLISLIELELGNNQISNIVPLSNLTNLTGLGLYTNQISDISPLLDLTGLTELWLQYNQISNIAPLSNLTSLTSLNLRQNQVDDISPLSNLIDLTYLSLALNQIDDILPLSNLTSLTNIDLMWNQIADISPLSILTSLTYLNLAINAIDDLAPLSNLTNLTHLDLAGNKMLISGIQPLSNLVNLTYLMLSGNQISDITALSNLASLTYLHIAANKVSDICPLYDLTDLVILDLGGNQITNITPLSNLTGLTHLSLRQNKIEDISPLSGLTNLTQLMLYGNQISDVSPLVDNSGLAAGDKIDLTDNPLTENSLYVCIPELEARGVNVLYDVPRTWYVDDDLADYPAADFTKIQNAVDAASSGDTIIVYPGTYTENVVLDKSLKLQGEDKETTIIDGCGSGSVVTVTKWSVIQEGATADNCTVSGFTIRNSGSNYPDSGVRICYSSGNTITDTIISGNNIGVILESPALNMLTTDNRINHNMILDNEECGIRIAFSPDNIIDTNTIRSNEGLGVNLVESAHSIITGNTLLENGGGLRLDCSTDNIIRNNDICHNSAYGIYLGYCLKPDGSLSYSSHNLIYLNNFDMNGTQAVDECGDNTWNSPEPITYTYKGKTYTNHLGNYWSDYHAYLLPVGYDDLDDQWEDEELAYDGNTGTFAKAFVCGAHGSSWLELHAPNGKSQGIRFWLDPQGYTYNCHLRIEVFYDGYWNLLKKWEWPFNPCAPRGEWVEVDYAEKMVEKARFKFYSSAIGTSGWARLSEFQFKTSSVDVHDDGIGDAPYSINSDEDNYPLVEPFENYEIGPTPYPVITSSSEITPEKDEYYVGDTLTAEFTITNRGTEPITFDALTVGGRLNGSCPTEGCPDFTHRAVTLQPDESCQYDGSLTLTQAGDYHFFCAYHTEEHNPGEDENNWNTNIDVEVNGQVVEEFNEARRYREKDITVLEETYIEPALGPASWEKLSGPWEEETDPYGDFSALLRKSIAINPNNPEIVYVGSDKGGGLYKSVDGGDNWQEINNGLPHLSWPASSKYWPVAAITIAPSNPDTVYVGTTDINPYYSWVPHGMGVYKSINGGSSWTPVNGVNGEQFPKYPISSMVVDPTNANTVYVGTVGGGIWKTPDGGDSWQHIWSPIGELCFDVNAIAISPANPAIIYAAAYNYVPLSGSIPSGIVFQGGLYKSETGGDTWEKIWGERVDDILIDKKDANTLYAVICGYRVCKSVDGGTNWDDISGTSGEDPLPNPSYDNPIRIGSVYSLTMDPDFTDLIYTASKWDCDAGGIYLSPNSGENWFPIGLQDERVEKITLASDSDYHALYAVTTDGLFKLDFSNSAIVVQKYSPVELRVYDSQEQVTGLVGGEVKSEIPKSVYYNGTITIFSSTNPYRYELVGTAAGSYGLGVISVVDGEATIFAATDIPTIPGVVHQYTIDWDALSEGEEGVTVQVDSDGDGEFEDSFTADEELTQDEFLLQTETTVDFDPDVLNLEAEGKYVTAYIELPQGYDIGQIDISSIRLNDTVTALTKPTKVGDYDKDSVLDLMVKFDTAAVQDAITVGEEVEVTITGEVAGIGFEGSDTIRVINN